jgi:uncharacterized membrane protein
LREKSESERKILGMLLVFITVTSVFTGFVPVLADDPLGEDGIPIPSAMTLTANPEWIYINGDESYIIATVYDHENYTGPIPNMVVYFETDLGILRNVSYGASITATKCWAVTNESGVAIAAVMPIIGSAGGNATVKAVTGKGDVWKEVTVEFVKAEWRVVLFPDALSKATAVNEDVTYTIMVRNAGTADDTYDLSIPSNEADYAALNKTTVSLVANTSEFVTLTVRDTAMGRYNTTVRAASPHANWTVTLLTIVREYGVNLTVEGGDHAEKTVAPSVPATYLLTVENTGSDTDSYDLSIENLDSAAVAQLNRTSVLNLAAGAKADVLLTVSDPDEGAYRVNIAATSRGRPGVSDTISTTTTVLIPLEPDLLITEIALNCGYLFGNESNQLCATVKNNGTAAAGPFNVSFNIGVFYTEARVSGGLAAGATTEICVTDPTLRSAGVVRTLLVTADCDAEVDESDEDNNERSIVTTVVNNGYKGKRYTGGEDLKTVQTDTLNGAVIYSTGDSQYLSGFSTSWTTYTVNWIASDLPVPGPATVEKARLYVIYTWDKVQGMPNNVSLSFNGMAQTRDAFYTDRKGYAGSDYPYGMLAYDVTANFSTGGNTAILTNLNPVAGNPSLRGMLLVVIYEDDSEPERTFVVNEGFDLLYGDASQCTTPAEATAYAPFDADIQDLANMTARLITVAPGAGPAEGELLFNGQTWTNVWNYAGSSQIGIDDRDVTQYLQADDNEAQFQSSADYMEASVAILVVGVEVVELKPDLTVIAITPNVGLLYANASNEICATVKNLDGADAGAFNVSFVVDGFSEEVRIAGLVAGAETTVCVTDPTMRNAGEMVTITVTADCNTEISETNETNNAQSIEQQVVVKVNGSVNGRITYSCNGQVGIADVPVNLVQSGTTMASTTTDGNGNYTFNDIVPGEYSVNASKQRLWNSTTAVTVIASTSVTADLQMLLKGDLNNNCLQADAGDVAMMKDASVGKIPADWRFDLNGNGLNADAGDVAMMKDASVGKIILL